MPTDISVKSLLTDTQTIDQDSVNMSSDRCLICGLSSVSEDSVVSRSGVGDLLVKCRLTIGRVSVLAVRYQSIVGHYLFTTYSRVKHMTIIVRL